MKPKKSLRLQVDSDIQEVCFHQLWCNISDTRDSVSSRCPNTEKRVKSMTSSGQEHYGKNWGVWIENETLSLVFDKSTQLTQKVRNERRLLK